MERIVCFDIETTGLDYNNSDRCIEIGAVEIIDNKITNNTFHAYINPEGKIIPPEVYMVHKISNAFLEDKPKMSEVAPKFLEFVGDSQIVAHNGFDFDFPFMDKELERVHLNCIPRDKRLDSLVIARNRVFGPKNYTLDSLADWFGVSRAARADAHGALIDSILLANVFLELQKTEPFPDISETINEQHEKFLQTPKIGGTFPRRTFPITDAEQQEHELFLDKIQNPEKYEKEEKK
ncbi:MAG: ribonuclease H-like domain-containing protein [Alphaproteobacteria bacterium]|nr:ribonuclease H-like domain-containing protein [Alphaproteobacteria bacterium]